MKFTFKIKDNLFGLAATYDNKNTIWITSDPKSVSILGVWYVDINRFHQYSTYEREISFEASSLDQIIAFLDKEN
jgi:hypothetical protein